MAWEEDQKWESDWHGDCINSYWEETKQIVYAKKMGLVAKSVLGKYPVYDLEGKSVCDIGGGAYSILLKCVNFKEAVVVDPCDYPQWTVDRYTVKGIKVHKKPAEEFGFAKGSQAHFDEVWFYNCLQHTIDPEQIIKNIRSYSKIIRVFEWIDTGTAIGHPHELKEESLNRWLGGIGKTEDLNESGCYGRCYYGVFKGGFYVSH